MFQSEFTYFCINWSSDVTQPILWCFVDLTYSVDVKDQMQKEGSGTIQFYSDTIPTAYPEGPHNPELIPGHEWESEFQTKEEERERDFHTQSL